MQDRVAISLFVVEDSKMSLAFVDTTERDCDRVIDGFTLSLGLRLNLILLDKLVDFIECHPINTVPRGETTCDLASDSLGTDV